MPKKVVREFKYRSSSNPNIIYVTLLYDDGTSSCNCPGWTRRVAKDGSRTCKHLISSGLVAIQVTDKVPGAAEKLTAKKAEQEERQSAKEKAKAVRRFAFDD